MAKFQNVNGRRYYEPEEKQWLIENYPVLGRNQATQQFNELFNHNKTPKTIEKYCHRRLGIRVSEERRSERYNAITSDIGTVSKNCRGEWKIKTDKGWIPATHSIADVPKGYVAIHLDGNKDNNSPENIAVVKNGIQTIAINAGLYSEDPEITRTGLVWAELYKLIKKFD